MAFNKPTWVRTWATAATSPIHDGVEGTDTGSTWIVTAVCVILVCVLLVLKGVHSPISLQGDTFLRLFASFPLLLYCYAISLRITWAPRFQEQWNEQTSYSAPPLQPQY